MRPDRRTGSLNVYGKRLDVSYEGLCDVSPQLRASTLVVGEQRIVVGVVTVLLVEDDPIFCEIAAAHLRKEGLEVVCAQDVAGGLRLFSELPIDIVLADVNLPDGLGHDMVRRMKMRRDCAAIYVTQRGASEDRLLGLSQGDDYVVKPVDLHELTARVRAVLRRYQRGRADRVIELADWTLDFVRRELADAAGAVLRLTRAEFDLVAALAQAGNGPLGRDYLVEVIASAEATTNLRTVDVLISRIRRKLAAAGSTAPRIVTVHAQGYLLVSAEG